MTIEIPVPNMAMSDMLDILLVMSLTLFALFNLRSRREIAPTSGNCDLRELEGVLSGLVQEASEQSAVLDQSLRMRRDELQSLLQALDEQSVRPENHEPSFESRRYSERYAQGVASSQKAVSLDDVPNESWLKPIQVPNSTVLQRSVAKTTYEQNLLKGAESVSDYTTTRTETRMSGTGISAEQLKARSTSRGSAATVGKQGRIGQKQQVTDSSVRMASRSLPTQVERISFDEHSNRSYEMVADASTTRIAKRLLGRGEPIHAVARKLELTTTQVRELYRLMRLSGEIADPASPQQQGSSMHIVRSEDFEDELFGSQFEEADYLPQARRAS
ncbi:MAG: hypothetical protein PHC51_10095 [bacterium]|nr:hypothetical protein [bacterium]